MAVGFDPCCELAELRSSKEEAIPLLFRKYQAMLLRMIALRLDARVLGKIDSEDVLQDVFVETVRRFDQYLDRPTVPVFVWLRQIASQVLIDTHRRYLGAKMRDVKQEVNLYCGGCGDLSSTFLAAQLAGSLTTPSQCAVRRETFAAVTSALQSLEPIDREVLVLRHLEELRNEEVAQVLGIDKFAASKRYLRALARLRSAMAVEE
jgi:RNA polymerase sigma-70 factor, ECF subfamily